MIFRRLFAFFIFAAGLSVLGAAEFKDGNIRLVINEKTGLFSLFCLTDTAAQRYDSFLVNKNPQTSFLTVNVDGKSFRPDKALGFRTVVETFQDNPVIMFDSRTLEVTEIFTFFQTVNSPVTNGVKITIYVKNKAKKQVTAGLRVLFDTYLGEGFGKVPFVIGGQNITKETIVQNTSGEDYWVSRGKNLSIIGSIAPPPGGSGKNPDYLHFANWKKLNDVLWKAPYHEGRSFTNTPYSIDDSAVCYYYENVLLQPEQSFCCLIFLAAEDEDGLFKLQPAGSVPADANTTAAVNTNNSKADFQVLQQLLNLVDRFIAGEISLTERELTDIDLSITRLKARYGLR